MRGTDGLSKEKHRGREIVFREDKYDDFMLNIHKRKVERKSQGHYAMKEKVKEAKRVVRKEKRKDIKDAIIAQFGDVTIDDDGAMITREELEKRKARLNQISKEAEEENAEYKFEDDAARVFVETTDMAGNAQKIKAVKRSMQMVETNDDDDDEEEEVEDSDDDDLEVAKRNARIASKMRQQASMSHVDSDDDVIITYGDANAESEEESEEESHGDKNETDDDMDDIIVQSSNPNKTKLSAKATKVVTVVEPVVDKKKKKEKKVNAITALWNEDAELPKSVEVVEPATKKAKKLSKSMNKEQDMYANLLANVVDRSIGGAYEMVRVVPDVNIGPSKPSTAELLISAIPLPSHWEAERYQKVAMADAMAEEKKMAADKKKGMKADQLYELKYDASYGWEEGDGSNEKHLGMINGLGPASLGGRHRKKPLSKKNSKSHNARKERAQERMKEKEDKEVKAAWENDESTGHGFGYESDGDDEVAMMGKHNKQRKRTEAKRKSVARVAKTEKSEGWSSGQRVGKKAYYFGSRDGAENM